MNLKKIIPLSILKIHKEYFPLNRMKLILSMLPSQMENEFLTSNLICD